MEHVVYKGNPPTIGQGTILNATPLMLDIDAVSGNRYLLPSKFDVIIGDNVHFGNNVIVNRGHKRNTEIGDNCYVWHKSSIGHDCRIGDHTVISAGVTICGCVTIGDWCYIAPGTVIKPHVMIGDNTMIGMNSTVCESIDSGVIAYGSPCKAKRENKWRPDTDKP